MQNRTYLPLLVLTSWAAVVLCLNCRTKFDVQRVCPVSYGQGLLQTNTSSVTACSTLCASNYTCRSVMYDPATTSCALNTLPRQALGESVHLPSDCPVLVYLVILKRHSSVDVWMYDGCESDADCTPANSRCITIHPSRPTMCLCSGGYTFNYRNDTCLTGCDTYGTNFAKDIYYIENNNFEEREVRDVRECHMLCLYSYPAQCRFVYYEYSTYDPNQCYLSAETALTKPEANRRITNPFTESFIRGCA